MPWEKSGPDDQYPSHQEVLARLQAVVGAEDADAAYRAYEDALVAGLCHEGAWEVALGAATRAPGDEQA